MLRRRAESSAGQAGFTLLETLVAVVILGLLMTGLSQALRTSLGAARAQMGQITQHGDIEAVERTLRALIERMEPGGVSGRPALFVGDAAAMAFTTTLPTGDGSGDGSPADVRLEIDGAHRLVLSWLPHLEVRLQPAPAPARALLLEDVDRLELSYRVPAGWVTHWRGPTLPTLIRIRVSSARGLRVPDVIIAPMRDRWRA